MNNIEELDQDDLIIIAKIVGDVIPKVKGHSQRLRKVSAYLAETFQIWHLQSNLSDAVIVSSIEQISDNTNQWHSQVIIDDYPEFVINSYIDKESNSSWKVGKIIQGEIAVKIDEAIAVIEEEYSGIDLRLRILESHMFEVIALWVFIPKDKLELLYVLSIPDNIDLSIPDDFEMLKAKEYYSPSKFVRILRNYEITAGVRIQ